MKRILGAIIIFLFTTTLFCYSDLILRDGVELSVKMEADEVFFKRCTDFDVNGQFLYLIALTQGNIFKIDKETGKLVKVIGSKGQGPGELAFAIHVAVKNNKVFVADKGFHGIKIYDIEGKLINEFKVQGYVTTVGLEVDNDDHIYLGQPDFTNNSMITVYNLKGQKLESLIPYNMNRDDKMNVRRYEYRFDMDEAGNFYILYPIIREIRKYSHAGKMLWKKEINNELINKSPERGKIEMNGKENEYLSRSIIDFEIMADESILISHSRGGCILDKNGDLMKVIKLKTNLVTCLRLVEIVGSKLFNVSNYKRNVVIFDLGEIYGKN